MHPLVHLANWILEPSIFLLVRVIGDFAAGVYLLVVRDYLAAIWFTFVGIATLFSEFKARQQRTVQLP